MYHTNAPYAVAFTISCNATPGFSTPRNAPKKTTKRNENNLFCFNPKRTPMKCPKPTKKKRYPLQNSPNQTTIIFIYTSLSAHAPAPAPKTPSTQPAASQYAPRSASPSPAETRPNPRPWYPRPRSQANWDYVHEPGDHRW